MALNPLNPHLLLLALTVSQATEAVPQQQQFGSSATLPALMRTSVVPPFR